MPLDGQIGTVEGRQSSGLTNGDATTRKRRARCPQLTITEGHPSPQELRQIL
jgi:hypothetical protein